jgi:hypothetical protein
VKIFFLIRSLDCGGAERQLTVLSKGLCELGHDVVIAAFYAGGSLEKELRDTKVRILPLNKSGRWDVFGFIAQLIRAVRAERPDVLHGYLEDPNLLTVVLKPLVRNLKIVWGIRSSARDSNQQSRLERLSRHFHGDWRTRGSCSSMPIFGRLMPSHFRHPNGQWATQRTRRFLDGAGHPAGGGSSDGGGQFVCHSHWELPQQSVGIAPFEAHEHSSESVPARRVPHHSRRPTGLARHRSGHPSDQSQWRAFGDQRREDDTGRLPLGASKSDSRWR